MKKVISASRRTDLVAFFPKDLSQMLGEEIARVIGPSGHVYSVDLSPENVHTFVLWSKNFENLIQNRHRLRQRLEKYNQLYLHFTITGMGGSFIERGVPYPDRGLSQLEELLKIVGKPERISVRFDPVVRWVEKGRIQSNLHFFQDLACALASLGIDTVRFSFAQWYSKSKKRAEKAGFSYVDPPVEEKKKEAAALVSIARFWNVRLYSCSQNFLTEVDGIQPSSCIDGIVLHDLHPHKKEASGKKDKSQRLECGCTESVDIGSYTQSCPHCCLYCYANPRV
jgi:hypothetical protein